MALNPVKFETILTLPHNTGDTTYLQKDSGDDDHDSSCSSMALAIGSRQMATLHYPDLATLEAVFAAAVDHDVDYDDGAGAALLGSHVALPHCCGGLET